MVLYKQLSRISEIRLGSTYNLEYQLIKFEYLLFDGEDDHFFKN